MAEAPEFALEEAASPAKTVWPTEGSPELDQFFGPIEVDEDGDLVAGWEAEHLTLIKCPWILTLSWNHSQTTRSIRCNKKVADSLSGILDDIWSYYEKDQTQIMRARMHLYGGCFEFRRKRGLSGISMHAYGAAIDFDPDGNPMYFAGSEVDIHMPAQVVKIFADAGWKWGNNFSR